MPPRFVFSYSAFHYLALAFYSLIVVMLIHHPPFDFFSIENVTPIQDVAYKQSDLSNPKYLSGENWHYQTLPDDWYHSNYSTDQVWYRVDFNLSEQDQSYRETEPWGLYLPHVTHNAEVFINDVWIGRGGRFDHPVSRHHNEPLLFPFSSGLLQQGQNQAYLRVKAEHRSQGLLGQIYLAPLEQLKAVQTWKHWLRLDFIVGVTVGMYILAAILFFFWLLRRQDSTYGIFALLLIVWATHNLNLFVSDIPVSARLWEAITMSSLGWAVVIMVFFNHRYVGEINHGVEKLLLGFSVLGLGIFFLPDIGLILKIGARFWDTTLVLIGVYSIFYLLRMYHRSKNTDIYLMLLAGIPILICGFHDIRIVNHLADRREGLIIQYSVLPAIVLFSWFLVRRFINSLNQAEELASTLEAKVEARGKKIEQQYARLSQLEKDRTLSGERERIMRDMHDGIGGQLVSLRSSLSPNQGPVLQEVRARIQACIDDLRTVINSLDPAMSDLSVLLGSLRGRFDKQLESAGITLVWNISEMERPLNLSPEHGLHLMRILQEVVTNAIKHSKASELVVETDETDKILVIKISDNGSGFDTQAEMLSSGRGLKNIRYRAEKLQASLSLESNTNGTIICLALQPAMGN